MVLTLIKKIRHSMICLTAVYQWAPLHFPCIRQKVNRRWNSRYRYETAAVDHSWLSSGTAMWSLGMRAVCAIGQFPAIQKRIIYCLAIKTSMFRNQGFFFLFLPHQVDTTLCILFDPQRTKMSAFGTTKILWIWSSVPPLSPSKRSTYNKVARWTWAWCVYRERPDVQRSV